jgi:hypothetical protein
MAEEDISAALIFLPNQRPLSLLIIALIISKLKQKSRSQKVSGLIV